MKAIEAMSRVLRLLGAMVLLLLAWLATDAHGLLLEGAFECTMLALTAATVEELERFVRVMGGRGE